MGFLFLLLRGHRHSYLPPLPPNRVRLGAAFQEGRLVSGSPALFQGLRNSGLQLTLLCPSLLGDALPPSCPPLSRLWSLLSWCWPRLLPRPSRTWPFPRSATASWKGRVEPRPGHPRLSAPALGVDGMCHPGAVPSGLRALLTLGVMASVNRSKV